MLWLHVAPHRIIEQCTEFTSKPARMSVSALFDGALVAVFDGSDSRSGALLGTMGSGIGNQGAIT